MGLKTTNYEVKKYGITLNTAYARLTDVSINLNGEAYGTIEIHQDREDTNIKEAFEKYYVECEIDKDFPVHRQLYNKAKEVLFTEWNDDIV